MPPREMIFNGVNGATGGYLTPPLPPEAVTQIALGQPVSPEHLHALEVREKAKQAHYGVTRGVNPDDLSSAGWGVIFPHDYGPAVREALKPLIDRRRSQAGWVKGHYFKEFVHNTLRPDRDHPGAYLPGDTTRAFLERNGAMPNQAADPERVPYYLLIAAGPEAIPYEFQYELDVQYAVGRVWFEAPDGKPDLAAFARYAEAVVAAETSGVKLSPRAVFWGTEHPDDRSTKLSARHLISPLVAHLPTLLAEMPQAWAVDLVRPADATKDRLAGLLGGDGRPAVLFTAGHGLGFPPGHPRQARHQGALLCQDFQGPFTGDTAAIPEDCYFSADDVAEAASPHGMIAFFFACYGAGTPMVDDFDHVPGLARFSCATPRPVVARLPQQLLSHPKGGALAVIGHVDRAWSCSFDGGRQVGAQVTTFRDTLADLLAGHPVGYAMEHLNQYHAALGTELGAILKKVQQFRYTPDPIDFSDVWTADNDARNYVVFGDPAVRLPFDPVPAPAPAIQTLAPLPLGRTEPVAASPGLPAAEPGLPGAEPVLDRLNRAAEAASAPGVRVRIKVEIQPPR